ncbi:hypothetical protein BCR32DRAFT_285615 [Anaeromyces robustus]|uniref:Uncharacterized protein n=1 Tax=Anaeromyces robustus TaxID=1754192 RepID=A0A1Y1WIY3_9FUNG|nr:hypothetical protein BCR32DRAFT_285615 [Anaeromyces robustus]|eukprot:ORX73453.1 hypothetical protein BCR32DRAFT_285615 [Anaeromyces robustus]
MSEVIKNLSQKRYNEIRREVLLDVIDIVFDTIASRVSIENKDKSYTIKKLTNSIELIYKLIEQQNNEKIPSEIIRSIKPRITNKLNNTFCYKPPSKNENINNKNENDKIIFCPNVQLSLEVSYNEIKKDVHLKKSVEHYRFFVFPITINNKEYIITFAEENKYTKREIIEILDNNISVDENVLSSEIKNKYFFI